MRTWISSNNTQHFLYTYLPGLVLGAFSQYGAQAFPLFTDKHTEALRGHYCPKGTQVAGGWEKWWWTLSALRTEPQLWPLCHPRLRAYWPLLGDWLALQRKVLKPRRALVGCALGVWWCQYLRFKGWRKQRWGLSSNFPGQWQDATPMSYPDLIFGTL